MSELTHVFVTVPEGRIVPMPANEAPGVGGEQHRCVPGVVYRVPWTRYVRGRVPQGDFVLSDKDGKKVDTPELARADAALKLEHDYTVAKDQRPDAEINEAAAKARETALKAETSKPARAPDMSPRKES